MSKRGSYIGGSTVVRWGSSWFSRPQSGIDPETGETLEERKQRLAAELKRRKDHKLQKPKKKHAALNVPKAQAKSNEQRRLARVAKNRAKLAEKHSVPSDGLRQSDIQQRDRMAKVEVRKTRHRATKASDG